MANPFLEGFFRRRELQQQQELEARRMQQQRDLAEQQLMLQQHGISQEAERWKAAQAEQRRQFDAQQAQRQSEQADMWRKIGVQLEAEGAARQAKPAGMLTTGMFPIPIPASSAQDFGGRMLEIIPKQERVKEEQQLALDFERTKRREAADFINNYVTNDPTISKMFSPQQLAEFKIASVLGIPISPESSDRLQASLIRDYMSGDEGKKKNALTGLKLLWTGYETKRQPLPSPAFVEDQRLNAAAGMFLNHVYTKLGRAPTEKDLRDEAVKQNIDPVILGEVLRRARVAIGKDPSQSDLIEMMDRMGYGRK